MGFLKNLFGGKPDPSNDWDGHMKDIERRLKMAEERQRNPDKAMKQFLESLPACNRYVVIASSKYNQPEYIGDVISRASDLLPWLREKGWDSYVSKGMSIWLETANLESRKLTPLSSSPEAIDFFSREVTDLLQLGKAFVHCPECDAPQSELSTHELNKEKDGNTTSWIEERYCTKGHLVFRKNCEIHFNYQ